MKHFSPFFLLLALSLTPKAQAQTPNWSQDIAPILYNNCVTCHRPGGVGPFSLMSFSDAVSHAGTIKAAVESGRMPPWPPDQSYNRLAHERMLSAAEKAKISNWVTNGQAQGNLSLAPPQPTFSAGGDLPGTPDLVLQIPTYTSTANTHDAYRAFVLPTGLTADQYITAMEAIPGNRPIVHHVVIYADTTGVCENLDNADPLPGYACFGGVGTNNAFMIGGWVPGTVPLKWPTGFGVKLPKNARVVVQIHYPAGTAGMQDSTRLRMYFAPAAQPVRNVMIMPVLNHLVNINTPLTIPANTTRTFTESIVIPPIYDLTILAIAPHMHYIGRSIESFAVSPNNDTTKIVRIPDWNFHWQGFYFMRSLMKLSGGTTVYGRAFYDNTSNNPWNPSNPPQTVSAGEASTDEMMVTFFAFTFYQPGDENIRIDSSNAVGVAQYEPYYKGRQLLQPYPVPASGELVAKLYFDQAGTASLDLVNMSGQVVKSYFEGRSIPSGYTALPCSVADVAAGHYTLRLRTAGGNQTQQVVVQH